MAEKMRLNEALTVVPSEDVKGFRMHLRSLGEEDGATEQEVLRELGDVGTAYEQYRRDAIQQFARSWPQYPEAVQIAKRAELDPTMTVESVRAAVLKVIAAAHEHPGLDTGQLEADRLPYGSGARVSHGPLLHFKGPNAEREAYACGMYLRSLAGDAKAGSWVKREMTEGIFGTGGAWVPADVLANAVISNVEQYGVARRYARLWPMTSASLSVPTNLEGLSIAAVDEKSATPTSDLSTGQVTLTAKEFAGGTRISRSLLDDSPVAIADFCVGEFARVVAQKEDQAVFTADGTSTYAGITGILWRVDENQAAVAGAKYEAAAGHDTFAEIDLADLTATMAKLPEYARKNARWYCSASAKDAILTRLAAAAGGNNVQTVQGGIGEAFLGYPIVVGSVLPSDTTATYNGTPILAFGDLARSSAFGDRRALEIAVDNSRYVEYRQVYVQVVSRFDAVAHMRGVSATVCGPMVVLFGKS